MTRRYAIAAVVLTSLLLLLNGVLFLVQAWGLHALLEMMRHLGGHPVTPITLPALLATGAGLILAGISYAADRLQIRQWFYLLSIPLGIFGYHEYATAAPLMISWSGLWTGEIIATEAASGVALLVLTAVCLVTRFA